ncbi:MAG: nitroreductase family protein [Bacillota bacterium]
MNRKGDQPEAMNCLETIRKRRSVRDYKDQSVSDKELFQILEAGRQAPSAGNRQPWRFILIKNRETIEEVADTTYVGADSGSQQHQDWFRSAPVVITVCTDNRKTVARYGEMGKEAALQDTAAAVENMLLAVNALGLGSCWIGGFRGEELRKMLKIPQNVEPAALLPIGYSKDTSPGRTRKNMEEILFYEEYGRHSTGENFS